MYTYPALTEANGVLAGGGEGSLLGQLVKVARAGGLGGCRKECVCL